jgi:glycosyltransferase involved in cell wall biosynthesis
LKHPEKIISLCRYLKSKDYNFHINIIGTGELEKTLRNSIEKEELQDNISMLGTMSPEKVREFMEKSNVFVFTSDYNEGWGAVLNESMNSGCAVVASHAVGSVPFLLEHNYNGLIYNNDNIDDLYFQVERLMKNTLLREKIGRNAYLTLKTTWNAERAAKNFFSLCNYLKEKDTKFLISDGPCSIASRIMQLDRFKKSK